MNKKNKVPTNQALGLLPVLSFMVLDNFVTSVLSYVISILFCVVCIFMFHFWKRSRSYLFMLIPSAVTLVLYSFTFIFRGGTNNFDGSTILIILFLIFTLGFLRFFRRPMLRYISRSDYSINKQFVLKTSFRELYFVSDLIQCFYLGYLVILLIYYFCPLPFKNDLLQRFLFNQLDLIIGLSIILYEQIRLNMMRKRFRSETWLPVLNEQGKITGCIAHSTKNLQTRKYYHPVIRVAIIHKGMLYLTTRNNQCDISPGLIDYPYCSYVLFRQSMSRMLQNIADSNHMKETDYSVRPLTQYHFENEKVKHFVNLYAFHIFSDEAMERFKMETGKLWTTQQIDDNLGPAESISSLLCCRYLSSLIDVIP